MTLVSIGAREFARVTSPALMRPSPRLSLRVSKTGAAVCVARDSHVVLGGSGPADGAENETEFSLFNRSAYEAFKLNPEVSVACSEMS